jgi:cytochrome c-type biogenesis protein CcmH/NrfF
VLISGARDGKVNRWLFGNHPMMSPPPPPGYTWSLWLLYAVFVVVIAALYWPSRWYARRKATNRAGWMKYI